MAQPAASIHAAGLYLQFPDGTSLDLTADKIEARAQQLLCDPAQIPMAVRDAEAFQLCDICPKNGSGDSCHAIRPILAMWDHFDNYVSHDRVLAVYRDANGLVISADTTMQRALQYLSLLSIMYYCETGKKYWRYFHGVHPLMATDDVVARVYLNMFWTCRGDVERTRALIGTFHDEITTTTHCQMERIRLFCRSDAFLNALILTQIASEFLSMDAEGHVQRQFEAFEKSLPV